MQKVTKLKIGEESAQIDLQIQIGRDSIISKYDKISDEPPID